MEWFRNRRRGGTWHALRHFDDTVVEAYCGHLGVTQQTEVKHFAKIPTPNCSRCERKTVSAIEQ